ncbi:MAG: hypothetical protein HC802_09050 [Caldilineaceae bacterium]|nr:hypothetical protein [Caldilineaceae bacterium]
MGVAGDHLIYAVLDGASQYLVRSTLDGEEIQRITDYGNRISFTLSPDDRQLAYAITDGDVGLAALGPLYVVELETMRTREVSDSPVIAFFWSPDSQKLAYLSPERIAGTIRFRWHVWDGKQSVAYAPTFPTRTFLEGYLTFFDQYAQSMTIWAPDSSAFAYAGIDEEDRLGIWVQPLDPEKEAVWVARGVYAAWSPR